LTDEAISRSARGVYGISVAAELSGLGPQTLRLYERWGLLTPARTAGGTRRYSDDDLHRLKQITELVDQGVNLAGIARILDLENRNSALESHNAQLRSDNAQLKATQRTAVRRRGSTDAEPRSPKPRGRPRRSG
jgi:MerR family transcriptional regulator/heat shock protein HspR